MKVFPWLLPSLLVTVPVFAEGIATDGSFGAVQNLVGTNVTIPQELGKTVGNNLFHSFADFNINTGQTVAFSGSDSLQNVISRVTGNNPSIIDGTLKSDIKNADFYFINPHGITFNTNAQVDVPAAFHVSTADKMDFGKNGGVFYADLTKDSQLSNEPPSAFGFLGSSTIGNGFVNIDNSLLNIKESQFFDIASRAININNSTINIPMGELRFVVTNDATINLTSAINEAPQLNHISSLGLDEGKITINESNIDISGNGAGRFIVLGGNNVITNTNILVNNTGELNSLSGTNINLDVSALKLDNSDIRSNALGAIGSAGSIKVNAKNLTLLNGASLSSDTNGQGDAGTVLVVSDNLIVENGKEGNNTFISSDALEGSIGHAGLVNVHAKILSLSNGGAITSDTYGQGNAGGVSVISDNVIVDGQNSSMYTGIKSSARPSSTGLGGLVSINADLLTILDGGFIASNTTGKGNAGTVSVVANTLNIDGKKSSKFTGISSDTLYGSTGNAGIVDVKSHNLSIVNNGAINSDTTGLGNAGNILIKSDNLILDGKGLPSYAAISSDSLSGSMGNSGIVKVNAQNMTILNGGLITSLTFGEGHAGDVYIESNKLTINGQNTDNYTGISSAALENSQGNAGNVNVKANEFSVLNEATISSDTYGQGNAGIVSIESNKLTINGQNSDNYTGISSDTLENSQGNAGDVNVHSDSLIVNGGYISSNTHGKGSAGNINIKTNHLIIGNPESADSTGIYSASLGKGSSGQTGNINIVAIDKLDMINSSEISIENEAETISEKSTIIKPGQINVKAPYISMKDSKITTESSGNTPSGGIYMQVNKHLDMKSSVISTTSNTGNGGNIAIDSGDDIYLQKSGFKTNVKGGQGNGGDILANTKVLVMDTGVIQANAVSGNGGRIRLALEALIPSRNVLIQGGKPIVWNTSPNNINLIQAASENGVSGTVNNSAPQLNLSGVLANVTNSNVDNNLISQDYCALGQGSSLSKKGKGALPMRPKDFQYF